MKKSLTTILILVSAIFALTFAFSPPGRGVIERPLAAIVETAAIPVMVLIAACGLLALTPSLSRRRKLLIAINTLPANVGTSKNSRRYRASAAITTRFLLGKMGADDEHIAAVAATSDKPIGVITDEAAAAEDPVNVELLGVTNRTLCLVAAGAIAIGADVFQTAAGKVNIKPTSAGTYWRVGVALTAPGADGDPVEVATHKPRKLIVIAALTCTDGTMAGAADLAAVKAEGEHIGDDLRAIAAALNGDADVALATT